MKDLKLSECRKIYNFCEDQNIDFREVITNFSEGITDFQVEGYRFISSNVIDEVQKEELKSDPYILGCFNAWFLADILGTSTGAIEKMQKAEAFEGIGEMIIHNETYLNELQKEYSRLDGYGHHFNSYDGSEEELLDYYVFRVN